MSVLLGAVVALAGGVVTTVLQARLQRSARREEYLWNKCAELYVDLLRHNSAQIAHIDDDQVDEQYGWTPESEQLRLDLTARVQLFGSTAVEDRWRQVSRAGQRLDYYARENLLEMRGDYAQLRSDAYEDPEYVRLFTEVKENRRLLVEQLRRELDTDRHLEQTA